MVNEDFFLTRLSGGLGNQLFQYAYARALSLRYNCQLYLDTRDVNLNAIHGGYGLESFSHKGKIIDQAILNAQYPRWKFHLSSKLKSFKNGLLGHYHEGGLNYQQGHERAVKNSLLVGYWQSEQYFSEFRDEILADFNFCDEIKMNNCAFAEMIKLSTSVSVHIRRGDYINNAKSASIYHECGLDYYEKSITLIRQQIESPVFFVFSDDISWCKKNINFLDSHVVFVSDETTDAISDLYLMSLCSSHIIANSTFSWWGAWLSSSCLVIQPRIWFKKESTRSDLIKEQGWINI